jgi:hypothetical protein
MVRNKMNRDFSVGIPGLAIDGVSPSFAIPANSAVPCDCWDKIKENRIVKKFLDDGRIAIGDDATPIDPKKAHFTSFGDTLEAPAQLRQNELPVDQAAIGSNLSSLAADPAMSAMEALESGAAQRRRGRPAKVQ